MPPRTYLTAPPGTEPTEATGRAADEPRERYVPGLAPASEPRVASRWRAPAAALLAVLLVVAIVVTVVQVSASQQAQDPSLMIPGEGPEGDAPSSPLRDAIPGSGDAGPDGGGLPGDG